MAITQLSPKRTGLGSFSKAFQRQFELEREKQLEREKLGLEEIKELQESRAFEETPTFEKVPVKFLGLTIGEQPDIEKLPPGTKIRRGKVFIPTGKKSKQELEALKLEKQLEREPYDFGGSLPTGARASGFSVDSLGNLVPTFKIESAKERLDNQRAQEILNQAGLGTQDPETHTPIPGFTPPRQPISQPELLPSNITTELQKSDSETIFNTTDFKPVSSGDIIGGGILAAESRAKAREAGLEVQKQTEVQRQKNILKSGTDLRNAELKIDNTFDSWLDTINRTADITGIPPGPVNGAITSVIGRGRLNEFYAGFKGGLVEYAAAIGRISIPGSRATRLISLFKGTAPSAFDTIPSGIQTTADSFRNALAGDMGNSPEAYIPDFNKDTIANTEKLKDMLRDFESKFRDGLYVRAFEKNPNLVPAQERGRIEGLVIDKQIKEAERLGGRIVEDANGNVAVIGPNNEILKEF